MPAIVLSPSLAVITICVYGFIGYTALLSFTGSKMFARFDFVGWRQYGRLFENPRWITAIENMAIFGGLYILGATCLGLFIAILIAAKVPGLIGQHQRIKHHVPAVFGRVFEPVVINQPRCAQYRFQLVGLSEKGDLRVQPVHQPAGGGAVLARASASFLARKRRAVRSARRTRTSVR